MTQLTKTLIALCLPLMLLAQPADDSGYILAELDFIKVKMGMEDKFIEAVKKHNDKYHADEPYRANLFRVMTGAESGWFIWAMGGFTYTDLDNAPGEGAHSDDWRKTIQPFVEEYGATEFWRLARDLSYSDGNAEPMEEIWFLDVKPGKYFRFRSFMQNIQEIHEERESEIQVWINQFNENNSRDVALTWPFDKWAERDAEDWKMKDVYNEAHGEGAWEDAMLEWEEFVSSMSRQVWRRVL